MKYFIKFLFLFYGLVAFGQNQTYTFAAFGSYKRNDNVLLQSFVNRENFDYFIFVKKNDSNKMIGLLYDFKNKYVHHLDIVEKDSVFSFLYKHSHKLNNYTKPEKFVTVEKNYSKLSIKEFQNKKRKKVIYEVNAVVENSDINNFRIFQVCCLHPNEMNKNFNYSNENITVINAEIKSYTNNVSIYKLQSVKNVDLKIEISQINLKR